jgi:hypothetical protein
MIRSGLVLTVLPRARHRGATHEARRWASAGCRKETVRGRSPGAVGTAIRHDAAKAMTAGRSAGAARADRQRHAGAKGTTSGSAIAASRAHATGTLKPCSLPSPARMSSSASPRRCASRSRIRRNGAGGTWPPALHLTIAGSGQSPGFGHAISRHAPLHRRGTPASAPRLPRDETHALFHHCSGAHSATLKITHATERAKTQTTIAVPLQSIQRPFMRTPGLVFAAC